MPRVCKVMDAYRDPQCITPIVISKTNSRSTLPTSNLSVSADQSGHKFNVQQAVSGARPFIETLNQTSSTISLNKPTIKQENLLVELQREINKVSSRSKPKD